MTDDTNAPAQALLPDSSSWLVSPELRSKLGPESLLNVGVKPGEALVGATPGEAPQTSPSQPHTLLSYARNPTPLAGSGVPQSGFVSVAPTADITDLNPEFAKRASALQQAAKAAGIETTVTSGYRSTAHQAELYAKYRAGTGGIAAPPGMSYHNYGDAVDMYATNPKDQAWLVTNAPKFGLYPGANFGDAGHFQIAGANPMGDHGTSTGTPRSGEDTEASRRAWGGGGTGGATPWSPPDAPAPASPAELIASEMKLQLLRGMFPQHAITPVEYDPFKALPQGLEGKVNVNEGIS